MKLKIDHNSQVPLHFQVENELRRLIESPKYSEGTFIPKEMQLAKQLGVSRHTIRHAIGKLVGEGLLERKKGVGTRIGHKNITSRLKNWMSFTNEMISKGIHPKKYKIIAETVPADEEVATALEIDSGKEVLKLIRVKGDEEEPFVAFISYLHPRIELDVQSDFSKPLYEILEKKYFISVNLSRELIRAVAASGDIAQFLRIEPEVPVLERVRKVYDNGSRPVEFCKAYYRADKFSYAIDIRKEV